MTCSPIQESSNDTVHIALAPWDLSDDYNRHCGVTMVSILENTKSTVVFHLLYDDRLSHQNMIATELNHDNYVQLCSSYGAGLEFHSLHIDNEVEKLAGIQTYTMGSLLRVYLPSLLLDIDKILYLDSDIVVTLDISELWKISLNEYMVAARVGNICKISRKRQKYYESIGINPNKYFNSGVLLLNLQKIRETLNLSQSVNEYLIRHPESGWPDQDALNYLLQPSLILIPDKYNYLISADTRQSNELKAILHFAGRNKPWKIIYGGVDLYYWKYLLLSPWGSSQDVLGYSLDAPNEMTAIDRLPEWIFYSSPKEQLERLWLIIRGVIWTVIIFDIMFAYYSLIRGENYVPKRK